ncbi:hypothetical protein LV28_19385 [Pandoraea pnomenusa]|uniref:Possible hemagglutinin (DUF637) n=1 Tax=Pandoraea pnomenusa TaxID=93220 RepID=A0A378YVW6_9BURK|nr:DUF637 domain-containing protein [Pandoraea pnomenusa]AIU28439.1 hypothetical protein LV28_19385 [Pandoraea pnomenusa]SUA80589.1 Possible hemagglutinin (DUF637) [Pandoraea pnomenusa]
MVTGLGNIALSAAMTAMTSSAFSQLVMTGSIDFGSVMTSGLSSAITAGLLNGMTYSNEYGLGFADVGGAGNSLSSLAGVNPSYVAGTASNAVATTADKLLSQGVAILAQSAIQAGVQSTIQGGSFLDALKASGINNLGAALAFQIGEAKVGEVFGEGAGRNIISVVAHAALGCIGSAASGNGCAGGVIGGAVSAAFIPDFIKAIDSSGAPLDAGHLAALSTLSSLAGSMFAGLAGADPNAGAFWAQNQAINNDAGSPEHTADAVKGGVLSTLNILLSLLMPALPGNPVMEVARNQFVDLMNAHAKRKMSEPPEQLIAEGVANGWTAVGGLVVGGRLRVTREPCW